MITVRKIAEEAKAAAAVLSASSSSQRNQAVRYMIEELRSSKLQIFEANQQDVHAAENENLPDPVVKRLEITEKVFSMDI